MAAVYAVAPFVRSAEEFLQGEEGGGGGSVTELADLPVIFISAYGSDETIAKALEVGAADYIIKPSRRPS